MSDAQPTSVNRRDTIVALCRTSTLVGVFERVTGRITQAYQGSRTANVIGHAISSLHAGSTKNIAIVLISAAAVHVSILVASSGLPGWRMLVIPAIAAAQGALLLANARQN